MMNWQDLSGEIPLASIEQALDDNGDGAADEEAWTSVQTSAQDRINDAFGGYVPVRYARAAEYARKIFLCEILFRRRGLSGDRNPFSSQATKAEDRLRALANGTDSPEGSGGGTEISEPAKISGTPGLMA